MPAKPSRLRAASRLFASLLVLVTVLPVASAYDYHEQATGTGSFDYIKDAGTSTEHSIGNGFTTSSAFGAETVTRIGVYLQRVGTAENACVWLSLRSDYAGPEIGYKCINAANIPTTAGWVDFLFDCGASSAGSCPVGITPGATYFFLVKYYGSCDTCMKMFWNNGNSYSGSSWPTVKYGQDGTSCCWQAPGTDVAFRIGVEHTPVVTTQTPTFSQDPNGVKVAYGAYMGDNAGLSSTVTFQIGPGSSGGYDTNWGYGTCGQGSTCYLFGSPYPQHTTYHYRAYGSNSVGTGYGSDIAFTTANYQPGTASTPSGQTYARPGVQQSFTTSATDAYDNLYYEVDINGDGVADGTSSGTYSSGSTGTAYVTFGSAGTYSVRARARDTSGCTSVSGSVCAGTQWGPWSGSMTVVVDGTAPSAPGIQSTTHAVGTTWYNNNDPSFTWTQSDSGGSGLLGSTHRLDAGSESGYYSHTSASYNDVSDGLHTFYVTVRDNAGNTNSGSYPFRVDTQAPYVAQPVIQSGTLGQNSWYTTDVTLRIDSADAGSGVASEWHGTAAAGPWSGGAAADTWTVSTEGPWTYYGRAVDNIGLARSGLDQVAFKIDKTPPTVTDNQADVSWTGSNPTLDVDFGDARSGLWTLEYTVYSAAGRTGTQLKPWTQFFSTTSDGTGSYTQGWQADAAAFQQGDNHVSVRVTDRAGLQTLVNDVARIQWDTVAPSKANPLYLSGTAGDNGWYRSDLGLQVDSADATSGITQEWHSNVGPSGPWSGGTAADTWTDATEGTESWFGRARDGAGNDYVSSGVPFKVDKTAPVSSATASGSLGQGGWYTSNAVADVSASDPVSGVASVRTALDGGAWTTTPGTSASVPVNGDGVHTVSYYARDLAGNTDGSDVAPRTFTVKVDTTVPSTSASLAGTAGLSGWYVSSVDVTVASTDATSGPASVWYQVDGAGWTQALQPSATFAVGSDGTHTVEYYSVDAAGNADGSQVAPHSLTFKVDRTAPTTTDSQSGSFGAAGWSNTPVTVTLLPTDTPSGVLEIRYGVNVPSTPTLYTAPFVVSAEGTTQVYYRTKDQAGNTETVVQKAVRVDSLAPTFAAWSQTPSTLDASHAGSVAVAVSVEPGPSGLASSDYRYSYDDGFTWSAWAPTAAGLGSLRTFSVPAPAGGWWQFKEGTLRYEVRATDGAGNEASEARSDFLERVAPQVTILAPTVGADWGNGIRAIQFLGRDLDHDTVTYTVRLSNDGGASYFTTLYTQTVAEDGAYATHTYNLDTALVADGSNYAVKVEATDGLHAVSAVTTPFKIDNTVPTVEMVDPADQRLIVQGIEVVDDPLAQTRTVGLSTPLRATAADTGAGATGVDRVRFFVDGAFLAEDAVPDASGLYEVSWSILLTPGPHTVSAVSVDRAGNESDVHSKDVVVVIDAVSL